MIEATRDLLAQTDARIEEIADEFARLQELRDALEVSRAALQAFIEHPGQVIGSDGFAVGTKPPAPVPRSAAVSSPPGGGSPAITQPGSARSGSTRAPATVAAPSTSASGSVGTPTPASHSCPECGHGAISAAGVAIHRSKRHGIAGRNAKAAVKAAQPVTPEHMAPDPTVFADAPRGAYMADDVMVIGGEAWTPKQWAGEQGKAYRDNAARATAKRRNGSEKFLCSRCSRAFLSRFARDNHETQVECQPVPTRPPASIRDTHDAALADAGIIGGLGE